MDITSWIMQDDHYNDKFIQNSMWSWLSSAHIGKYEPSICSRIYLSFIAYEKRKYMSNLWQGHWYFTSHLLAGCSEPQVFHHRGSCIFTQPLTITNYFVRFIILVMCHFLCQFRLSDHAKQLLNNLGSGMIQNVKFRDVWGFVGQKGIKGFAEIEQVILNWLLAWT